jgi:kynurenine 3-monooxygenase
MPDGSATRCTLIGGGLAGGLLAVYLARAGHSVDLYEMRPDPASGNAVRGRSINLAISVRGIHALQELGLADGILKLAVPMRGRMIHGADSTLHFQPYDKDPSRHINSISRADLNTMLLEAAKASPNARVHFDWKCRDVDLERPAARLVHTHTQEERQTDTPIVIGIDGAWSAVRRSMQRLDRFNYSQHYLRHGYKELSIPAKPGGGFAMEPNALHIWPRRSYMMIALPNADGSFTCTLFFPHGEFRHPGDNGGHAAPSFAGLQTRDDVKRFFEESFPDAVPLMPTLLEDFEHNPIGSMTTIRCAPWSHDGKVALVGDAAHAVVPFYGQGANASFEDCTALHECVTQFAPDWQRIFSEYERRRRENADAIADLAIKNFLEMRDKTASRLFHAKKKVERTLHTLLPGIYTPLYTMVSFTRTPYAEAVRRARRQDRIVIFAAAALVAGILGFALYFALAGRAAAALATALAIVTAALAWLRSSVERDRAEARSSGARLMT